MHMYMYMVPAYTNSIIAVVVREILVNPQECIKSKNKVLKLTRGIACYTYMCTYMQLYTLYMPVLYLQPHIRFGAETVHHSWAASKKCRTGYLSKTSSKLLWKKSSVFKHVRRLATGSRLKIYLY